MPARRDLARMLLIATSLLACTAAEDRADDVAPTDSTDPATDVAPTAPDPVDPDQRGPYEVGVDTLEFTDSRGKEMTVEVWYPADRRHKTSSRT